MSLREEDREKNGCPSRGLGLAAAALGVGVGAALYYFFSKRTENPSSEGSTSQQWRYENNQALYDANGVQTISDDSYSTIDEYTTTDTSIHDTSSPMNCPCSDNDDSTQSSESYSSDDSNSSTDQTDSNSLEASTNSSLGWLDHSSFSVNSDVDTDSRDWYSQISLATPYFEHSPIRSPLQRLVHSLVSPVQERSRERSWTLEECSICFDVILRDQEVMSLPCTHRFHQSCILPWLQEQQTCPNCRKNID